MVEIVPAIIGQEFKEVNAKIASVEGLVSWVQLDVIDGRFAPNFSWDNPADLADLPGTAKLEAHLMIESPELEIMEWQRVADRVLVHYESTNQLEAILQQFENSVSKFGLALLMDTPLEPLESLWPKLNHVQLMGIERIGFHGQPFDERVIERVRTVRAKLPHATIAVDGGVTLSNAAALVKAGATHLVVGSAIWNSGDIAGTIKQFQNAI